MVSLNLNKIQALLIEALQRACDAAGFRNIAGHNYQQLQRPIAIKIIEVYLDDFLKFSQVILQKDSQGTLK